MAAPIWRGVCRTGWRFVLARDLRHWRRSLTHPVRRRDASGVVLDGCEMSDGLEGGTAGKRPTTTCRIRSTYCISYRTRTIRYLYTCIMMYSVCIALILVVVDTKGGRGEVKH